MTESEIRTTNSGAAAGLSTCSISFGTGTFEILNLDVTAGLTTDRAQSVRVVLRKPLGDGTFTNVYMGSGFFSPNVPFIMEPRVFHGPALIESYVFHLDTTSHNLTIDYRRILV